jgi:hypothetical protein
MSNLRFCEEVIFTSARNGTAQTTVEMCRHVRWSVCAQLTEATPMSAPAMSYLGH